MSVLCSDGRLSSWGNTCAVGGMSGPGAVGGTVSGGESGGLVAHPAGIGHRVGEHYAIAEHNLTMSRGTGVTTRHR